MSRRRLKKPDRSGFVLFVVVWFMVLLTAFGSWVLSAARSDTALTHNLLAAAHAEALADAGLAQAVHHLQIDNPERQWEPDDLAHHLDLGGGSLVIRIEDEATKIDVNKASDKLLTNLLLALGITPPEALRLGASIADWVSKDGPARPMGAKASEYQAAGLSYVPPNAPFENLDEIGLVLGMTPEIMRRMRPYVTIYGGDLSPNMKNISPIVRRALLSTGEQPPSQSSNTPAQPQEQPGAQDRPGQPQAPTPGSTAPKLSVTLKILARSRDGGVYIRRALISLDPSKPEGYTTHEWRRGVAKDMAVPNNVADPNNS